LGQHLCTPPNLTANCRSTMYNLPGSMVFDHCTRGDLLPDVGEPLLPTSKNRKTLLVHCYAASNMGPELITQRMEVHRIMHSALLALINIAFVPCEGCLYSNCIVLKHEIPS